MDSFLPAQFGDFLYRVQEVDSRRAGAVGLQPAVLPLERYVPRRARRAEPVHEPAARDRQLPGRHAADGHCACQHADSKNRNVADRIRYVGFSGVNPQEYFSYLDPVTYGHNSAAGANRRRGLCVLRAVRARGVHLARTVDDLLRQEQQALQASGDPAEAGHGGDGRRQHDVLRVRTRRSIRIRSRTSSAPAQRHRMQRRSQHWCSMRRAGPGKVKPKKMREILQDSAFRHDLDPFFSSGFALSLGNLLAINAQADQNAISQFDPNVFTLTHIGVPQPASRSINGSDGESDADAERHRVRRADHAAPAPGQPFVVGIARSVSSPADITAAFSLPADPPGVAGPVEAAGPRLRSGIVPQRRPAVVRHGSRRGRCRGSGDGAAGGNSADLLGDGVLIPSGRLVPGGASFFGTFEGGVPFQGRVLQPDRQGLQPARRLRLRQCRSGGQGGHEEALADRFDLDRARIDVDAGPFFGVLARCGKVRAGSQSFLFIFLWLPRPSARVFSRLK